MNTKWIIIFLIVVILLLGFMYWQLYAYQAPQPFYRVIKSDNKIEIREYPELTVAEVTVSGERYASINQGFRILASYIFGGNQRHQNIGMTAPVLQEKIKDQWVTKFIMPAKFNSSSLPVPNNSNIHFSSYQAKRYIVIRFRGLNSDENIQAHVDLLNDYIKQHNIKTVGSTILAFYNPPWILPFLRRNEIMMELLPS